MKIAYKTAGISIVSAIFLSACSNAPDSAPAEAFSLGGWGDVSGEFISADDEPAGEVAIKQTPNSGILVRFSLSGLSEGWHGVHFHQIGDCSDGADGFKASGGHINPEGKAHGLLNPDGPDAADMPNIYAGADEIAISAGLNPNLTLEAGGPLADEDGFAVVVHANEDDHVTQPIGGAGARVACAAFNLAE